MVTLWTAFLCNFSEKEIFNTTISYGMSLWCGKKKFIYTLGCCLTIGR